MFKKDGLIASYDHLNRLDGKVTIFKKGTIQKVLNYKNGKKQGWGYSYYPNGQLERKSYYEQDESDGPEIAYFQNGQVSYNATIKNNKRLGSFYSYSNDGRLELYSTYDITGERFYTCQYDISGKIIIFNSPISAHLYSIDTKADTVIMLHFEVQNKNIKDLYVTIATPPQAQLDIRISVNDTPYDNFKIVNNVIRIKNAFPNKGLNRIFMTFSMFYKNQKIIDSLNADLSILRD